MTDFPAIFDSKGVFQELPDELVGTLDEAHAIAYTTIKFRANELEAADSKLASAIEALRDCVQTAADFQQHMLRTFPKLSFHDLWKQNFSRK
jgi:hypothetical protein